MNGERGTSLLEIVLALMAGSIVIGVVGALLATGATMWTRGRDLSESLQHAAIALDVIVRDVQLGSDVLTPRQWLPGGNELVLAIRTDSAVVFSRESDDRPWVIYTWHRSRGELRRLVTGTWTGSSLDARDSRLVCRGLTDLQINIGNSGVAVSMRVQRGRVSSYTYGVAQQQRL